MTIFSTQSEARAIERIRNFQEGSSRPKASQASQQFRPHEPDRDWFDTWGGPILQGGLETASSLSDTAGMVIPGDKDWFDRSAVYLDEIKANHPEWNPHQVDSWWQFFTSAKGGKALYGGVAQTSAHMAATAGAAVAAVYGSIALGATALSASAWGLGATFLTAFALEGQGQYDRAISEGATEEQARKQALYAGGISGALEVAQVNHLLRVAKGARKGVVNTAVDNARRITGDTTKPLSVQLAMGAGYQGLQEVLQGSTQDLLALGIYASPEVAQGGIGGFIDRRAQEFIIAGALGGTVGLVGTALPPDAKKGLNDLSEQERLNHPGILMRRMRGFFEDTLGVDSDTADRYIGAAVDDSVVMGGRYGLSAVDYFRKIFTPQGSVDTSPLEGESTSVIEGPLAWFHFANDGKQIIEAFKSADFKEFIGHTSQVFMKRLQEGDFETLSDWLQLEPGQEIQVPHQRKFALALESYLVDGKVDDGGLVPIFETYRMWARQSYRRAGMQNNVGRGESGTLAADLDIYLGETQGQELQQLRLRQGALLEEIKKTHPELTVENSMDITLGTRDSLRNSSPLRVQGNKADVLSQQAPKAIYRWASYGAKRVIDAFSGTGMIANSIDRPAVRAENHPQRFKALEDMQKDSERLATEVESLVGQVKTITDQNVGNIEETTKQLRELLEGWKTESAKYLVAQALNSRGSSIGEKTKALSFSKKDRKEGPSIGRLGPLEGLADSIRKMGDKIKEDT